MTNPVLVSLFHTIHYANNTQYTLSDILLLICQLYYLRYWICQWPLLAGAVLVLISCLPYHSSSQVILFFFFCMYWLQLC